MKQFFVQFYEQQHDKFIHTFKTMIAVAVGYGFVVFLPKERAFWIIITIVFVMMTETLMGLQIKKSILRIAGTFVGALFAMLLISIPHNDLITGLMLITVTFLLSMAAIYYKHMSYAGAMGVVTFCIIALPINPSLQDGFMRIFDVGIGIIICLLVSRLVLPLSSKKAYERETIAVIHNIAELARQLYLNKKNRCSNDEINELETLITQKIAQQRQILMASGFEIKNKAQNKQCFEKITRHQRGLFRNLVFTYTPYQELKNKNQQVFMKVDKILEQFIAELILQLDKTAVNKQAAYDCEKLKALVRQLLEEENDDVIRVIHYTLNRLIFNLNELQIYWNEMRSNES